MGRWMLKNLYFEPLFRSRCVSAGKRLFLRLLPDISGHARILIGDDFRLEGHFAVTDVR